MGRIKEGREGKKGVKTLPQSSREEGWSLGLRWAWWDVARKFGRWAQPPQEGGQNVVH